MHCDPYHLTDTVVVDDFDFVDLDTGKGPGITTLEEDVASTLPPPSTSSSRVVIQVRAQVSQP